MNALLTSFMDQARRMASKANPMLTPGRLVPYKLSMSQVKDASPSKLKGSSPKIAKTLNSTYTCTVSSYEDENGTEVPMYMAMADMCITPTGFPNAKKLNELCRKVELMCGVVSQAYTSKTTHILAGHVKTSKVEIARGRNIPIITAEWIEQLWEACNKENNPYIHASLPKYKDYECPLFYNINFYFSKQYDPDTRLFYENAVKEKGGLVVSAFRRFNNAFYICQTHENDGTYRFALGNDVPCVAVAWISESIRLNTLAPVDEYEVRLRQRRQMGETFVVGRKEDTEEDGTFTSTVRCEGEAIEEPPTPTESRKIIRKSTLQGDRAGVLPPPPPPPPRYNGYESGSDSGSSTCTLNATTSICSEDTFTDDTLTSVAG